MLFTIVLQTVDNHIGRFDQSMINDQGRMEMLVTPIEDDKVVLVNEMQLHFQNDSGAFLDIREWYGVTCDGSGDVISIEWNNHNWACGEVSFDLLPPALVHFDATKGFFTSWVVRGTISTERLPRSLETFVISGHAISGTLDLTVLPPQMTNFEAFGNALEGTIYLENLPRTMRVIGLSKNGLWGTICLTKLPYSMRALFLAENNLSGEISLDYLPEGMVGLHLQDNKLYGSPSLARVPASMTHIVLEKNYFEGEAFQDQKIR